MKTIDPITLEVVRGSFVSTVFQMRATLLRTAYAPILYDTLDFSCGLLTPNSELVAMSEDFAGHVFAMTLGLGEVMKKFGDDIHPGDIVAVNDPYTGGTHLNDVAFYTPFFADGKLLLFIGVRAHFADVGGATPGSFSGQDTEIYQEGMRIVPVKIFENGKLNQGLWDVLFANMRLSDEREGDALAMLDTARVAEMSVREICSKYGARIVEDSMNALLDSAEANMRRRISQLPQGDFYYEQYMDTSGLTADPMPLKAKMTIKGDSMTFDFTGTAAQVVGPMNCGVPVSQGGIFVVVKSWLDPKTPVNGGTFRPMKFVIPEGSCLAAQLPAPVGGCWEVFRQLQSLVVGLFSQAIPHDPGGEVPGAANHVYVGGYDGLRGRRYILYEYPQGGAPATIDTDGFTGAQHYDCGDMPGAYPAESAEQRQPLIIEGLTVSTDKESPGYRRSGFGVTRRIRILSDQAQLSVMTDRAIIPPWGAGGAYPGSLNSITVVRGGEEIQPSSIPGKVKGFPLKHGDVILMQATAGGGVGDPLTRELERVQKEVFEGFITSRRARDIYGVVIENDEVNRAKTRVLREELKGKRHYLKVVEASADEFDERGCRVCRLSPASAAKLAVKDGNMVELLGSTPAPLRAWVIVGGDALRDGISLGPIGREILKVTKSDRVWAKALDVKALPVAAGRA